jgi:cell division protein FtsB
MDSVLIATIASAATGIVTWFFSKNKRENDFISELQASINLLAQKNNEQLAVIIELREQIAQQQLALLEMRTENEKLRSEVRELNEKLTNAKITIRK